MYRISIPPYDNFPYESHTGAGDGISARSVDTLSSPPSSLCTHEHKHLCGAAGNYNRATDGWTFVYFVAFWWYVMDLRTYLIYRRSVTLKLGGLLGDLKPENSSHNLKTATLTTSRASPICFHSSFDCASANGI